MFGGERSLEMRSPGIDTLNEAFNEQPEVPLDHAILAEYVQNPSHLKYLENPAYNQYLKIHKVAVGASGSEELVRIADELSEEYMPRYLDAAASAYSEAALHGKDLSAVERMQLVTKAERIWEQALRREAQLQSSEYSAVFPELENQYRMALSLIYTPLVKSMIVGNVTDTVRHQVFSESALLGKIVAEELDRYAQADCNDEVRAFAGLGHEINALNTMLYVDDPRYLPMPSSARADSGYYHPEQTHDIVVINQHWGNIKKVIPAEIKGRTSLRDRKRYKALLIRGKMHLSIDGSDPCKTAEAFYDHTRGVADARQLGELERISTDVREMLRLYQQGVTPDSLAVNSITRFYSSKKLNESHPEIATL